MTVRPLLPEDLPELNRRAEASGFPYDLTDTEAALVVVDADGSIVTACVAKRIVELYLYPMQGSTLTKKRALELLHERMPPLLKANGYNYVEAFIPREIAERFAKRLERTFGWVKNWQSWTRKL